MSEFRTATKARLTLPDGSFVWRVAIGDGTPAMSKDLEAEEDFRLMAGGPGARQAGARQGQ